MYTQTLKGSKIRMKSNYLIRYMLHDYVNRKGDVAYFVALTQLHVVVHFIVFVIFMLLLDFLFFSRYYISSNLRSLGFHWWRVLCAHLCHILLHLSSLWVSFFFCVARALCDSYSQFSILCVARFTKEENEQHKLCDIGCKISKKDQQDTSVHLCITSNSNIFNGWTYRPQNAFVLLVIFCRIIHAERTANTTHEEQFLRWIVLH